MAIEKAKKIFEEFLKANKQNHFLIDTKKSYENLQKHFNFENNKQNQIEFVKIFEKVFGYCSIGKKTKMAIFWQI